MADGDQQETTPYHVVVNDEEQYSIWPADQAVPDGWSAVGPAAPKDECLAQIKRLWTDMRPRSLRDRMAARAKEAPGD